MISGIGIDITELDRVAKIENRLARRILTPAEQGLFQRYKGSRKTEFLAGRFAAKEAYAKAAGVGIGRHLSFQEIEIINTPAGKPELTAEKDKRTIHVSISHSRDYACAQVIIEDFEKSGLKM